MSLKNRYIFLKRMYPEYLILINNKGKLTTCFNDKLIWDYVHNKIINLERKNISFLILDNLVIVQKKGFEQNNFERYLKVVLINCLLKKERFRPF